MTTPAIQFWCGVAETAWNAHPVTPGEFACVAPIYGIDQRMSHVRIAPEVMILQDSGAYGDACLAIRGDEEGASILKGRRLTLQGALQRQDEHATRFNYTPTYRVSYDAFIDETWATVNETLGIYSRKKQRWSEADAIWAVEETVKAARYLHQHRNGIACILSAQGVSATQYLHCVQQLVPMLREGDMLGLGGWCIIGKMPTQMRPLFRETIQRVIPFLGREGVKAIHLFGCLDAVSLGDLLWLCDQHGIRLSTDSVGPQLRPIRGKWGYANWTDTRYRTLHIPSQPVPDLWASVKSYEGTRFLLPYDLGLHRAEHVRQVRAWLTHFRQTRYYHRKEPRWLSQPTQLPLLLEETA